MTPALPALSRRVAMHPDPGGRTEWDQLGNGQLRILVREVEILGWQVSAFDLAGFLGGRTPNPDADVTHVHWTERFALSAPQPLWVKALTTLQTRLAPDRRQVGLLYRFARRHVRRLAALRPLVYQVHDLESNWLQPTRSHLLDRAFKLAFLREARAWVVHEASCLPLLDRLSGRRPERLAICPLGDYAGFHGAPVAKREARARLGLGADEMVFLFAGYSSPRRNPRRTVAAFAAAGLRSASLVVASRNASDYLPTDLPHVLLRGGLLANDTLRDLYCAADWIVMPGRSYLTSAVVRTALSYGRPVICREFGNQADMARGAALWLAEDTDDSLTRALASAAGMAPLNYARYCEAATTRSRERSWSESVARYRDLLETLAPAGSPASA